MKKSDIFELAVKIFGLYFFIQTYYTLQLFLTTMLSGIGEGTSILGETLSSISLNYGFYFIMSLALALFLTARSRFIAAAFIPSENDNEINWVLDRSTILELATLIIGGYLLVFAASSLLQDLVNMGHLVTSNLEVPFRNKSTLFFDGAEICIGLLLVFNAKRIVGVLNRIQKD